MSRHCRNASQVRQAKKKACNRVTMDSTSWQLPLTHLLSGYLLLGFIYGF